MEETTLSNTCDRAETTPLYDKDENRKAFWKQKRAKQRTKMKERIKNGDVATKEKLNIRRELSKKCLEQHPPMVVIDLSFDDVLSDKVGNSFLFCTLN